MQDLSEMTSVKSSGFWLDGKIPEIKAYRIIKCKDDADKFFNMFIDELEDEKSFVSSCIREDIEHDRSPCLTQFPKKWQGDITCLKMFEKEIYAKLNEKYNKYGLRFDGGSFEYHRFEMFAYWAKV